jgi:hypothetical protein
MQGAGQMSDPAFVCALRLLFAGKDHNTIADAIVEALPNQNACDELRWYLQDRSTVAIILAVSGHDAIEDFEEEEEFIGTEQDLVDVMRYIESKSDLDCQPWRDDAVEYLRNQGLLVPKVDKSVTS